MDPLQHCGPVWLDAINHVVGTGGPCIFSIPSGCMFMRTSERMSTNATVATILTFINHMDAKIKWESVPTNYICDKTDII
jgi:hypothetical protein